MMISLKNHSINYHIVLLLSSLSLLLIPESALVFREPIPNTPYHESLSLSPRFSPHTLQLVPQQTTLLIAAPRDSVKPN